MALNLRVLGAQSQISTQAISYSKNVPNNQQTRNYTASITEVLDREIRDETAELESHTTANEFPGFTVKTEGADVKLSKQVGASLVSVRFTVSSSLADWPGESKDEASTSLMSMPEFQVQIKKNNRTLEVSCYFEEYDMDEESGEPITMEPVFNIDELVLYEGEPKETEFAVSAEYFQDDLLTALLQYLSDHGINHEFAKNLVNFATGYEKTHYIELMKRLKSFVSSN